MLPSKRLRPFGSSQRQVAGGLAALAAAILYLVGLAGWQALSADDAAIVPCITALALVALAQCWQLARCQGRLQQRDAALAAAAGALDTLVSHMDQGVVLVSPRRVVELCNRRAMELLDVAPDGAMPHADVLVQPWRHDGSPGRPLPQQAKAEPAARPFAYTHRHRDGRSVAVHEIPRPDGGSLRLYTDVTRAGDAEPDIRTDIEDLRPDGATLDYAPVLDTETGAPRSLAVQVRTTLPGSEPSAERDGWMLHAACREAATWAIPVHVSVRLCRASLDDIGLEQRIADVLHLTGLAPDRLDLEIPAALLNQPASAADRVQLQGVLRALKDKGVRLSLADAGREAAAAASALVPFRQIKIDPALTGAMTCNPAALAEVKAVLAAAAALQAEVVATGVSERTEHELLRMLGCAQVQGPLAGTPQPPEWARDYLWRTNTRLAH